VNRASCQNCRDLFADIRRFYLFPEPSYSVADLATLWRVSHEDVQAIFSDALHEAMRNGLDAPAFRVKSEDADRASSAYHVYRAVDVEEALGDDFDRVRSSRWRTVPLQVHLPRFIVDRLTSIPFVPSSESVAARAERLLCEAVEAECVLQSMRRNPSS
jgi:hypothetical protein